MSTDLGQILVEYDGCLKALRNALKDVPVLNAALFDGFEDWERQLTFKLAPRLSGSGCLIAAVAGGTNTGKSTVFNALLGRPLSAVSPFGAHTKYPLIAANARRCAECLEPGRLLPDALIPQPWTPGAEGADAGPSTVFVVQEDALPDDLILLDTPDIDSIAKDNWELAKNIREAGDVLVAVLTAQKYSDTCVVEFFHEALKSGRRLVLLMNMVDDGAAEHTVTRHQLDEFEQHAGVEVRLPRFILPRLTENEREEPPQPVSLDGASETLSHYLAGLDTVALKAEILGDNLRTFAQRGTGFIERTAESAVSLKRAQELLETMAAEASRTFKPMPGREVVTVVHDFIQQRAKGADRVFGAVTANVAKAPGWLLTKAKSAMRPRRDVSASAAEAGEGQRRQSETIVRRLYSAYLTEAVAAVQTEAPEVAAYIEARLKTLDPDALAHEIGREGLETDDYIAAYREYAFADLEERWKDRKFRWTVRSFYNLGLLGSGTGMLILLWTGGWVPGLALSEILVALGVPVLEHTVARGAAYLWGDKLTGLVEKWQRVQQQALEHALIEGLVGPALGQLPHIAEVLSTSTEKMEELNAQCLQSH